MNRTPLRPVRLRPDRFHAGPKPYDNDGVSEDLPVVALVQRARAGDQTAWDELVDRYMPLVWAICLWHGLTTREAEDATQRVWLALVDQLHTLPEPAAFPRCLVSLARRECGAHGPPADPAPDKGVRAAALLAGFRGLDARCRRVLSLLARDPLTPEAARCLARLRRCPELLAISEKGEW